jgi:hypothetical protein
MKASIAAGINYYDTAPIMALGCASAHLATFCAIVRHGVVDQGRPAATPPAASSRYGAAVGLLHPPSRSSRHSTMAMRRSCAPMSIIFKGWALHYDYKPVPVDIVRTRRRDRSGLRSVQCGLASSRAAIPPAHPRVASVIPGLGRPDRALQTVELYRASIPAAFWTELKAEGLLRHDVPVPGEAARCGSMRTSISGAGAGRLSLADASAR